MISPNGHQLYFVDQANWQVVVIDTVLHRYERLGRGTTHPSPDDEPEFGSFWKHIAGTGLSVLSYGEGLDLEDGDEGPDMEPEGQRLFLISPVPNPCSLPLTASSRP